MKVFISWSGSRSKHVALALREWLADVIQAVEPWVSEADIDAGARWGQSLSERLQDTQFGIVCVTRDNQEAPWLLFEAGALSKKLDASFVCPYLIDMTIADLLPGPLTQFQAKIADRDGTWGIVESLNNSLTSTGLKDEALKRIFHRFWPDLESKLSALPQQAPASPPDRTPDEMIREILEIVRSLNSPENRIVVQPHMTPAQEWRDLVKDDVQGMRPSASARDLSRSIYNYAYPSSEPPRRRGIAIDSDLYLKALSAMQFSRDSDLDRESLKAALEGQAIASDKLAALTAAIQGKTIGTDQLAALTAALEGKRLVGPDLVALAAALETANSMDSEARAAVRDAARAGTNLSNEGPPSVPESRQRPDAKTTKKS